MCLNPISQMLSLRLTDPAFGKLLSLRRACSYNPIHLGPGRCSLRRPTHPILAASRQNAGTMSTSRETRRNSHRLSHKKTESLADAEYTGLLLAAELMPTLMPTRAVSGF